MIARIVFALAIALGLISFPVPAENVNVVSVEEEFTWEEFHADAVAEYADEFTRLFNSYEFKQAKNGAPMIRRQGEKSFKFVSKGK